MSSTQIHWPLRRFYGCYWTLVCLRSLCSVPMTLKQICCVMNYPEITQRQRMQLREVIVEDDLVLFSACICCLQMLIRQKKVGMPEDRAESCSSVSVKGLCKPCHAALIILQLHSWLWNKGSEQWFDKTPCLMRLFCSSCAHSISKQHVHSFPILIFPNATHCHPPPVLSLWRPTLDLRIPLKHSGHTDPPPTNLPSPPPPLSAHTHLIVIDSVFVPLCIAVASDEDTYCGTALIVYCTETTGLPPVALSLHSQLYTLGLGKCREHTIGWDGTMYADRVHLSQTVHTRL